VLIVFLMIVFSFAFVYENLPKKPVELKVNYLEPEVGEIIEYGAVPVFAENLRFNHNLISYSIDEGCDSVRRDDMVEAFNIFSEEVEIVSFFEDGDDPDILVGCSDDFVGMGENLFAAGEGGPSRIINTSLFRTIEEGNVILYNGNDCDYPIVALHELGHVFGFDHSPDPRNIMFNISGCGQRMSGDMADVMMELYSVEALADIKIKSVEGAVGGRYLSFNISVLNEGMVGIRNITLTVLVDDEIVDVVELGEIGIGYGRTLRIQNMRVPGGVEVVRFVLDREDVVRELNEGNNVVEMSV